MNIINIIRDSNGRFIKGSGKGAHYIRRKLTLEEKEQRRKTMLNVWAKYSPEKIIERNKKISEAQKGEKGNNWKGGIAKDKKSYARYWYRISPKKRLSNQQRYFLKKGGGELPVERIQMVYEDNIKKYGTLTCYLCEEPIPFGKDHLEHKTPLSRRGTNKYNNLAIACQKCNCKKHNKTEEEYRKDILLCV